MALPRGCLYGVPGPLQVTVVPSPIAHRTLVTFAVAVTVTPPAVAVAVAGPNVVAEGVAHIHIGIPTTYVPAARGWPPSGAPGASTPPPSVRPAPGRSSGPPGRFGRSG